MNNLEKAKHMSQNNCSWEDILYYAEDLYSEQMVKGLERWLPACNLKDNKSPMPEFAAILS